MPGLSTKPDASFFRKITKGAVGARAVSRDLEERFGHQIAELENGATGTKLWKGVKRKRVRIPDLVCSECGVRIESRAKSKPELSMSHSTADAERAWDFGFVDGDLIAFPGCNRAGMDDWSRGRLLDDTSFWHARERIRWRSSDHISYFFVEDFRAHDPSGGATKGVTEGSERTLSWDAIFSTRNGTVTDIDEDNRIRVERDSDGNAYRWTNRKDIPPVVEEGDHVSEHQVIASVVPPASNDQLRCAGRLPDGHLRRLLDSPERTQRFAGIKLARLREDRDIAGRVREVSGHPDEDLYVRLEGAIYRCKVEGEDVEGVIGPYLDDPDDQIRLEAVVALAETATPGAVRLLAGILHGKGQQYYLRSAAAWALGRIGTNQAVEELTRAFGDADPDVREEALEALTGIGEPAVNALIAELRDSDEPIAAGIAETLRRGSPLPDDSVAFLQEEAAKGEVWPTWLLGHLAGEQDTVRAAIAELQDQNPQAHFAASVFWTFVDSWVSDYWEPRPNPEIARS